MTQLIESPIQLLLIEDNPGDARLLRQYISEFQDSVSEVHVAESLEAVLGHDTG